MPSNTGVSSMGLSEFTFVCQQAYDQSSIEGRCNNEIEAHLCNTVFENFARGIRICTESHDRQSPDVLLHIHKYL